MGIPRAVLALALAATGASQAAGACYRPTVLSGPSGQAGYCVTAETSLVAGPGFSIDVACAPGFAVRASTRASTCVACTILPSVAIPIAAGRAPEHINWPPIWVPCVVPVSLPLPLPPIPQKSKQQQQQENSSTGIDADRAQPNSASPIPGHRGGNVRCWCTRCAVHLGWLLHALHVTSRGCGHGNSHTSDWVLQHRRNACAFTCALLPYSCSPSNSMLSLPGSGTQLILGDESTPFAVSAECADGYEPTAGFQPVATPCTVRIAIGINATLVSPWKDALATTQSAPRSRLGG